MGTGNIGITTVFSEFLHFFSGLIWKLLISDPQKQAPEAQFYHDMKVPAGSWFDQTSLSLLVFLLEREEENTCT